MGSRPTLHPPPTSPSIIPRFTLESRDLHPSSLHIQAVVLPLGPLAVLLHPSLFPAAS